MGRVIGRVKGRRAGAAHAGFDAQLAAPADGRAPGQGQAQAGAAVVSGDELIQLTEFLEDGFLGLGRNARAGVETSKASLIANPAHLQLNPPFSVNLIALFKRLLMICRSRWGPSIAAPAGRPPASRGRVSDFAWAWARWAPIRSAARRGPWFGAGFEPHPPRLDLGEVQTGH